MGKFKVGQKVLVKATNERGIIISRDVIKNSETNHVKVQYVVKLGYGVEKLKSFEKTELENIDINIILKESKIKKIYSVFGKTIDDRKILVVACIKKSMIDDYTPCISLNIGYSVCHPDDNFDFNVGWKIAERRANKSPISIVSFRGDYGFTDDDITKVLTDNLHYIKKNIGKFIK